MNKIPLKFRWYFYGALLMLVLTGLGAYNPGYSQPAGKAHQEWNRYAGDESVSRYSALTQIYAGNVQELRVAWQYNSGDAREGNASTIECNPIVVKGIMYVTSPKLKVIALDAATGTQRWTFDPFAGNEVPRGSEYKAVNRGVTYWAGKEGERILFTAGHHLYALNASTGERIPTFGQGGRVDLRAGLDRDTSSIDIWATTPGIIYKDLLILGSSMGEGPSPAPPGHIRAYNVRTGARVWTFRTIPYPGEYGYDTWGKDSWKTAGGANAWAGMSLDPERKLVFAATGSPAFDFYGGDRPGKNLFANCVLALNAETGKYIWHYQVVHHDLWDRDLPCPPNLVQIRRNGKVMDAVAQVTKHGFVFVLNRDTGEPLYPVEERPVPASDLAGEQAWPTQPYPTTIPPFVRQELTEAELSTLTPESQQFAREKFRESRTGHPFTPPSREGTIILPGLLGGANWSGAAYDPQTGLLYVNANELPNYHRMVETPDGGTAYPYGHQGYTRFRDPAGYPAIKPPWGTLTAIDLNEGTFRWQVPLGEYPELTAKGIPPTGTENMGGCLVTAGGLVFIASTKDEKFRAFDKQTGKVLWETQLPAGGYAAPATYEIAGRQYVVIAAGGGGKMGTRSGDAFVVFALPERK